MQKLKPLKCDPEISARRVRIVCESFLIFRIENICHALESKLWVFSGSGSDLCSCQFSLCMSVRVYVCVCASVCYDGRDFSH